MDKIKTTILSYLQYFIPSSKDCLSLTFIKGQAVLFIFCLLLYLIMTVFDWVRLGYPDKQEFRSFLVVLGSFSTIITMYGKWLVDKDNDGVPDMAEETINKEAPPKTIINIKENKKNDT